MFDPSAMSAGESPAPWAVDPLPCVRSVCRALSADTLAIGLIHVQKPRPDELLVVHGFEDQALADWFQRGFRHDPLLAESVRAGAAAAGPASDAPATLTVTTPHDLAERSWWWLRAARKADAFTADEIALAGQLVRGWAARFNLPAESGVGIVIVGHDDRLIALNLVAGAMGGRPGPWVADLLASVRPVLQQRYPELAVGQQVDLAIQLGPSAFWVWARRARAANLPDAENLHLELRILPKDELPIVGVVEDERVARALAFLHGHFHRSPTLADAARHAHMSPFHFHRIFKKQVGVSPKQYLQQKQLQVAKWLLRSGRTPVGVIAQHAGFSSHGHFTSTFHRLVGVSPSQYREMT